MDETMTDLLEELADDGGRPLSFTPGDLARRGRRARRRRTAIAVGGVVAVGGAVVAVALAAVGGAPTPRAVDPGAGPSSAPTSAASPSGSVSAPTAEDLAVAQACTDLEPALVGWALDAQVTDRYGTTASFVAPDRARWRVCSLETDGGRSPQGVGVSDAWPLDTTPVPDPWPRPDSGIEYADECPKDGPPSCSAVLFTGVFPLREGVASVEVETPGGDRVAATTGESTYVVRFAEARGDDPLPAVFATLRDAGGAEILRYDYNGLLR